jgi:hypothetical protein
MEFGSFEEFWKALGRLYDETLEIKESIKELHASAAEDRQAVVRLAQATQSLLTVVERDHDAIMDHERRLREIEELRRQREGHSPQ